VEDIPQSVTEESTGLNLRRANMEEIRKDVDGIEWSELLSDKNVKENWKTFRSVLQRAIEKHVPTFRTKRKIRPQWVTQEIVRQIRTKTKA
jgi:hypothetical protein